MTLDLTIFSAPKPFTDPHIATIQRNAILSWTKLPDTAVILLGQETGLAETAQELGVTHIQDVERSPSGAPLMNSMFALARKASPTPLYCIVNADILLFPEIVEIARLIAGQRSKFVLLGQRWDLDVETGLDFSGDYVSRLKKLVETQGTLHRPAGSDYFLFPAACYLDMPAFVIGRAGWDNWMIYHARKNKFPAVDATGQIQVIHQNHDYSHLPGGQPHYHHPETSQNIRLAGGRPMTRFTLLDADYRLENGRVVPQKLDARRLWRRIEVWPLLTFGSTRFSNLLWKLRKLVRQH